MAPRMMEAVPYSPTALRSGTQRTRCGKNSPRAAAPLLMSKTCCLTASINSEYVRSTSMEPASQARSRSSQLWERNLKVGLPSFLHGLEVNMHVPRRISQREGGRFRETESRGVTGVRAFCALDF